MMKKSQIVKIIIRVALFLLILSLGTAIALIMDEEEGLAWSEISGDPVQALIAQDDTLYAAQSGKHQPAGIYHSPDGGNVWQNVCSAPGMTIHAIAVHPTNDMVLYAGGLGGPLETANSLWRSTDGGQTWYAFMLGLPANPYGQMPAVTALAVDPNHPDLLFVGTDGQGVYRFDTKLMGYELLSGGSLYKAHVQSIKVAADSTVYALINFELYAYKNDSWQQLGPLPDQAVSLAVAADYSKTLYVGTASSGIYKSSGTGKGWTPVSSNLGLTPGVPLKVTALTVDDQNPTRVVAGTAYLVGSRLVPEAIYESINSGQQWTKLDDVEGLVKQIVINDKGIYAATTRGMLRYDQPEDPLSVTTVPGVTSLTQPSGKQVLILVLSAGLAGLVLLGRTEWITEHH
jgi:photosystem II stability/assembly factor-like uncharacterized protein